MTAGSDRPSGGRHPHTPPSARETAARVLSRVEKDGAFASAALDAELERHPQLDARERALATELVYGCLRTQGALLERLRRLAPRGLPQGDPLLIAHLLVAAYQLLVLDRIPGFAAVDAAVRAVREARGPRVGGFANAILRKLAATDEKLQWEAAVLRSVPEWLRARLEQAVGPDEARALLGVHARPSGAVAHLDQAVQAVRVVGGAELPAWLADAGPGRVSPRARLVRKIGDLRRQEGWTEGVFAVQEEGSQAVALALGARSGEKVLDACAGRGQKASLLAEQVGREGELWAADLHLSKLRALGEEFRRLKLPPPRIAAVDWTAGPGSVPPSFDRVLVDAPCSGVGTLRRRPEIALRLQEDDPERLGQLAVQILRTAAGRLRPGGRLLFAVCSVLPEECERVTERARDLLRPTPFDAPELSAVTQPEATSFRLLPLRHGSDGYFIASFTTRN